VKKCPGTAAHEIERARACPARWPRPAGATRPHARGRMIGLCVCGPAPHGRLGSLAQGYIYPAVWPRGSLPPQSLIPSIDWWLRCVSSSSWRVGVGVGRVRAERISAERRGHGGERIAVAESGGGVIVVLILYSRLPGLDFEQATTFYRRFLGLCFWAATCYRCSILVPDFELKEEPIY